MQFLSFLSNKKLVNVAKVWYHLKNTFAKVAIYMRYTQSVSDLRKANRNRVYRFLYDSQGDQTVQDVSRALSLSLPTVNQNLNELIELGLIDNSKIASSNGGRRPHLLSVIPSARCAVGVEISPHHMYLVVTDLKINELGYRVISRPFEATADYAAALAAEIQSLVEDLRINQDRVLGVGITLPGIINAENTILEYAPTLVSQHLDLSFLRAAVPYSVKFFNDANAGGFAEWWDQPGQSSMAYLSLGRGIGGAILVNGIPYEGENRRSAEFGHVCIRPGGKTCSCGRKGCLEAYCSTAILSNQLGITLADFFRSLETGDGDKVLLWEKYLADLAIGIVNIHTMLDCDVVLGGPLSPFLGKHIEQLKKHISQLDLISSEPKYVRLCRYHEKSNGIGAALKYVDNFISNI